MKWTAWGPGPAGLKIAIVMEEIDGRIRVRGFFLFDGSRRINGRYPTVGAAWDAGIEYLDSLALDDIPESEHDHTPSQKP